MPPRPTRNHDHNSTAYNFGHSESHSIVFSEWSPASVFVQREDFVVTTKLLFHVSIDLGVDIWCHFNDANEQKEKAK